MWGTVGIFLIKMAMNANISMSAGFTTWGSGDQYCTEGQQLVTGAFFIFQNRSKALLMPNIGIIANGCVFSPWKLDCL